MPHTYSFERKRWLQYTIVKILNLIFCQGTFNIIENCFIIDRINILIIN